MCACSIPSEGAAVEVKRGEIGAIALKLPLPPGTLPTLWQNDERYIASLPDAFPGYYQTGDAGFIDEDGYLFVMTRTDDIINVAGHRLSTGGMEEVLAAHPDVAECAVMGVADAAQGPGAARPHRAEGGRQPPPAARSSARRWRWCATGSARSRASRRRWSSTGCRRRARARFCAARSAASRMARPIPMPATIDDPAILDEITGALAKAGYPEPH